MENFEITQKVREDLIDEIDAIIQYDNHIHSTQNSVVKSTLTHIMHEEMHHVGELLALLNYLNPEQKQHIQSGINEFTEQNERSLM